MAFWLTCGGYVAVVGSTAWIAARVRKLDVIDVVRGLNTIAAPITVAGLYGVSESTQVTVTTTGVVHHYPWLPAWLAGGVALALLVWLVLSLSRATAPSARSAIERRALLLIVAPVAVFLFVASLPGPVGLLDSFEEGQLLAGSHLIREGFVPWRDVLLGHGLLFDAGNGLVGIELIDDSRWGSQPGSPCSWFRSRGWLCTTSVPTSSARTGCFSSARSS